MDKLPAERYAGNVAPLLLATLVGAGLLPADAVFVTGAGTPIGYTKRGKPIYPMAGGDQTMDSKLDEVLAELRKANAISDQEHTKPEDGGRTAAAADGKAALAQQAVDIDDAKLGASIKASRLDRLEAIVEAQARQSRDYGTPASKARLVAGGGNAGGASSGRMKRGTWVKAHPVMDGIWNEYQAGEFLGALQDVQSFAAGFDAETVTRGKAKLDELGLSHMGLPTMSQSYGFVDHEGKATLGTSNSTGGYVLPNNLVDSVVKPNVQRALYQLLCTVINGVAVRGVDQPYRLGKPSRMTFQDWGATKENVNETYGSYSAVLGTLARVYDISKQYARFSAGAAETDVIDELTKAAILGENYYMVAGAGSGSVGVGDPTYGIYTALAAAASFNGYTTAFSGASNSTLAGSAAAAFASAMGSLAVRSREAQAIVVDATTFWTLIAQGSDTAGFWVSPELGPTGFTKTASGGLAFWNVPLLYDSNLGVNATTKIAMLGEWDALKLYRGMEFRIDSSDVAGTRWDQNLIGFRGEEEIGFHAGTAVNIGAMQLVTGLIP